MHTTTELKKLKTMSIVRYKTVSRILSQCEKDILFYLTSYSVCQSFAYGTHIRGSQLFLTDSNTHGHELDESKCDGLHIGKSEAH